MSTPPRCAGLGGSAKLWVPPLLPASLVWHTQRLLSTLIQHARSCQPRVGPQTRVSICNAVLPLCATRINTSGKQEKP